MEEQRVVLSNCHQQRTCPPRKNNCTQSKQLTKAQLIAGRPATSARIKAACKKVLPLWIVPAPLSLASIPVGLYILHDEYLKYTDWTYLHWAMNGVSLAWAAGWFVCNCKSLRDDYAHFNHILEQAPDTHEIAPSDMRLDRDDGSAEQVETDPLLRIENY